MNAVGDKLKNVAFFCVSIKENLLSAGTGR